MMNLFVSLYSKIYSLFNTRYVDTFVPVKTPYTKGSPIAKTETQKKALKNLIESGKNVEKMVKKYPVIRELDEVLFIEVVDAGGFKLTGILKNGNAEVKTGWDTSKSPSFVLPLFSQNLEHMVTITKDRDLNLNEIYRIVRVLFIPFLKGLYGGNYSHTPKDKSYLKLDNFIHVEVKNDQGVEVEGFPGPAKATVVNVDGQWLVFEGLQGDPDIKYSMSVKEALEFAYLVRVKLIQASPNTGWADLKPVVDRYNRLKKEVTVYEREWHSVEERD